MGLGTRALIELVCCLLAIAELEAEGAEPEFEPKPLAKRRAEWRKRKENRESSVEAGPSMLQRFAAMEARINELESRLAERDADEDFADDEDDEEPSVAPPRKGKERARKAGKGKGRARE